VGLIDFGDMHYGITASEAAIAAAYGILGNDEPLELHAIVVGISRAFRLMSWSVRSLCVDRRAAGRERHELRAPQERQPTTLTYGQRGVRMGSSGAAAKNTPAARSLHFSCGMRFGGCPQSEKVKQCCKRTQGRSFDLDVDTKNSGKRGAIELAARFSS